jgi:hypothetical protein
MGASANPHTFGRLVMAMMVAIRSTGTLCCRSKKLRTVLAAA